MGSAASRCPDWDAKPCEAINDVDGGTPCDVPRDELEKAKEDHWCARYRQSWRLTACLQPG